MNSVEIGIRDLLDLVGKQRDELTTLRAENERLRDGVRFVLDNSTDMSARDRLNLELYLQPRRP